MNLPNFLATVLILTAADIIIAAPDRIIEYKVIEGGPLKLHCFFPEGHSSSDKKPVMVFFFGGGWTKGNPSQFYPQSRYLAKQGMVAISAQYRTNSSHGTGIAEAVQDARSALRHVRAHAAELGIDPEQILAGGGSAGGHLAACAAIPDAPDEPGEDARISCRPGALVLFNPVLDLGPGGYAHVHIRKSVKDWKRISPYHHITQDFPPTLILVGTRDEILPVSHARKYEARMKAKGVHCELVFYKGQGHGFANRPDFIGPTIQQMDTFLRELGYVKGPPPVPVPK